MFAVDVLCSLRRSKKILYPSCMFFLFKTRMKKGSKIFVLSLMKVIYCLFLHVFYKGFDYDLIFEEGQEWCMIILIFYRRRDADV